MKKNISFYRSENKIIAVNEKRDKIAWAECGKTDKFDLIFGMRLAALRLCSDPIEINNMYSSLAEYLNSWNAEFVQTAIFKMRREDTHRIHANRAYQFGVKWGLYSADPTKFPFIVNYGTADDEFVLNAIQTRLIL